MKWAGGELEKPSEFVPLIVTPLGLFGLARLGFDRLFRGWQTTSITDKLILQMRQGTKPEYRTVVVECGRIKKIIPTTKPPTLPPFETLLHP